MSSGMRPHMKTTSTVYATYTYESSSHSRPSRLRGLYATHEDAQAVVEHNREHHEEDLWVKPLEVETRAEIDPDPRPEPRVIRTVQELKALDPEASPAVRFSASSFGADFSPEAQLTREVQQWDSEALEELLPATVLPAQPTISAEQVRTEAERRWPDSTNSPGLNAERAWRQRAFIQGARFALGLTETGDSND